MSNDKEVEIPDERPLYWKPENVGESLYGRLDSIEPSKHGKVAVFAPALLVKDGESVAVAEVRVGLNWSLRNRVISERIGMLLGLTFKELIPTDDGPAKSFKVVEVRERESFKNKVRTLSQGAVTWPPDSTGDEPEDDDLPF